MECLLIVASIKGSKLLFIICLLSSAIERVRGSVPRVFAEVSGIATLDCFGEIFP